MRFTLPDDGAGQGYDGHASMVRRPDPTGRRCRYVAHFRNSVIDDTSSRTHRGKMEGRATDCGQDGGNIMARRAKTWQFVPPRRAKAQIPAEIKAATEARAGELVEKVLKPRHVVAPPEDPRWNYVVDIGLKWFRSYLYFCSTYACPGPNALSPSFEVRFVRMEYRGDDRFALAYMRYTGQWIELYPDLSLDECIRAIGDEPHFQP
jgi:hypothetical protein